MDKSRNFASRLGRLSHGDAILLAEALVGLTAASLKVKFVPFRRIAAAIGRGAITDTRSTVDVSHLRWAVEAAARRLPLRTKCFEMALCLQAMLRSRGVASVLHYGVRRGQAGDLGAHVWLSVHGDVVLGGECAPDFACVAAFATPVTD